MNQLRARGIATRLDKTRAEVRYLKRLSRDDGTLQGQLSGADIQLGFAQERMSELLELLEEERTIA